VALKPGRHTDDPTPLDCIGAEDDDDADELADWF